ncbi:MAG: VWA domain-containing protein [Polyangiales bacterium]
MSRPVSSARVSVAIGGFVGLLAIAIAPALIVLREELHAFRWEKPWWLLAIVAAPIALGLTTWGADAALPRIRVGTVRAATRVPVGWRARVRDLPGILRAVAIALFALALARPQTISESEVDERSGIDIMIALDVSGSMNASDLKPTRLGAAKQVVQELIERRPDDRIGAAIFARDAYLLSALTFDHVRLSQLVGKMQLGIVTGDGTAIGDGLGTCLARLRRSSATSRVMILLTDGDNNAGAMSPDYATGIAKELGVKIYTVQMGNGDEVDAQVGVDRMGTPIYGRARYPVNPELLKKIARETGGEFYLSTDTEQLRSSMHQILDKLTKTRFEAAAGDVVERFPWVLAPGVIAIMIEVFLRALVLRRFP